MKWIDKIVKQQNLNDVETELLKHGIDIIVNDSINFTLIILLSLAFNQVLPTIIYLLTFSSLRKYSGGIHAYHKISCTIIYLTIYLGMIFCINQIYNRIFLIFLSIMSALYIQKNSPMEHHLQPLEADEIKHNKYISKLVSSSLLIFVIILPNSLNTYVIIFAYILLITAISMYLLYIQERKCYESKYFNN